MYRLVAILMSLIRRNRRTFFVLDGLDLATEQAATEQDIVYPPLVPTLNEMISFILRELLTQDYGNVSVAISSRPFTNHGPQLFDIADVSVRLSTIEPDLRRYIGIKIGTII